MAERVLLIACDPSVEQKIREKLEAEGSAVLSVAGLQDVPLAMSTFGPTLAIFDDKKLGPHQVADALSVQGKTEVPIAALSDKRNEYGAALGIGCIDGILDWAMEGCVYILGCLGIGLFLFLVGLLIRWLF
jgi:hypothetical protein